MLQKGFSKVLIIVIALIVIGGGILILQLPENQLEELDEITLPIVEEENQLPVETEPPIVENETADWKTYQNEEYSFEVQYPVDLDISKIISISDYRKEAKEGPGKFWFDVAKETWLNRLKHKNDYKVGDACLRDDIGALTAYDIKDMSCVIFELDRAYVMKWIDPRLYVDYIVIEGDFQIIFSFTEQNDEIFNQILSTFKFTSNQPIENVSKKLESLEDAQEELLFPCIALDIKIGDCTNEISEESVKTMKDYLAYYTPVDLTDAEVVYCSENEEDKHAHFWMFKTFYLDHWVGIATACVTDVVEPLPIEFAKMTKDYRINILAYKGIESGIMRMADGQVYNADIERRDTELKSVQEAQDELSKYWKLDTPLEIDQDPPYSWEQGYIYSNINRPYIYISVNKYMLNYVDILYRTLDF